MAPLVHCAVYRPHLDQDRQGPQKRPLARVHLRETDYLCDRPSGSGESGRALMSGHATWYFRCAVVSVLLIRALTRVRVF